VGGVAIGGLSSEEARNKLAQRVETPVSFYQGAHSWKADPSELGASTSVQKALATALLAHPNQALPLKVGVDVHAVRRYVKNLDEKYRERPVNAKLIGLQNLAPSFQEAKEGRKVDVDLLTHQVVEALRTTYRSVRLPVPLVAIDPKVTSSNWGPIIVIRRGSNHLYLYDGSHLVQTFGVATGQSQYPTPLGDWHIVTMQRNPWWLPPDSPWAKGAKPIPPGPGNPLGTRWMGLDAAGVGIHGTPDAASIGYSASHGCIRMRIPDAESLFTQVEVGTPVYIVSA
jgi:lipoprotein-anchoring transpeptidase ErfK/SrfK